MDDSMKLQETMDKFGIKVDVNRDGEIWRASSDAPLSLSAMVFLTECPSLRELTLTGPFDEKNSHHLGRMKGLKRLFICDGKISREAIGKPISQLRQLHTLDFADCKFSSDALRDLHQCNELRELHIGGSPVKALLSHIAKCSKLEILSLNCTDTSDRETEMLSRMTELKALSLSLCDGVTDRGLSQLVKSSGLKKLMLEGTSVTNDGLRHLKELNQLEVLSVNDTTVDENGLSHLEGSNLKTLYLVCELTKVGIDSLTKMPSLRHLYLGSFRLDLSKASASELAKHSISVY